MINKTADISLSFFISYLKYACKTTFLFGILLSALNKMHPFIKFESVQTSLIVSFSAFLMVLQGALNVQITTFHGDLQVNCFLLLLIFYSNCLKNDFKYSKRKILPKGVFSVCIYKSVFLRFVKL